jgi:hypothetical protein
MQTRSFLRRVLLAGAAAITFGGTLPAQATLFQTGGFVDPPVGVSVANPAYSGGAGGFSGIWDPLGTPMAINYWCYQLDQFFSPGSTYNYTASILSYPDLSRLFTEVGGSAGALATSVKSAAFQLAIWELEYDSGHDLSSGAFIAASGSGDTLAAYNQAQIWLAGLVNYNPDTVLILLHSDTNQDFITDVKIPARDLLLPEPSSLLLLGLGLAALAFVGMRRRGAQASRS